MFRPLEPADETVEIRFEERPLTVPAGQSVAAALLGQGIAVFRETAKSGTPRGPYCLMGSCFECLVRVDGVPGVQACMTTVRAGMEITLQRGAADLPEVEP